MYVLILQVVLHGANQPILQLVLVQISLFFISSWCKIASAARNLSNSIPQEAATTFAFHQVISFCYVYLQVSWVRLRDWHILSTDETTFTKDERFQVLHAPDQRDWTLGTPNLLCPPILPLPIPLDNTSLIFPDLPSSLPRSITRKFAAPLNFWCVQL